MKFSRREVIVGGAALAACGRTDLDTGAEHMATPLGTPISLTASGVIKNGSVGGVNADALVSPYGLPMEIYEIKWLLSAPTNVVIGAGMGCSFEMGDLKLTNGYPPINSFCKSILMTLRGGNFVDYEMSNVNGEEIPTTPSYANFVWRLQRQRVQIGYVDFKCRCCLILIVRECNQERRPNSLIDVNVPTFISGTGLGMYKFNSHKIGKC